MYLPEKVMTVSYGTFACTLDGFDDPFTTMQLVAEYFRKLSADDHYFGSEPLQPDASTLHQIAKSANPNRIDAEVADNSVILRQADIIDAAKYDDSVSSKAPPPKQDTLITTFNEKVNDTNTADELSPSLEVEIPSKTVSAAVKALKSGEAIDRWLETTNQKMATPEHVSKANALECLKATAAATEIERATRMDKITPNEVIETDEERRDNTISYRCDPAKVRKAYELETSVSLRPKAHNETAKNGTSRPLELDLDQRIDCTEQTETVLPNVQHLPQAPAAPTPTPRQKAPERGIGWRFRWVSSK